MNKTLRYTFFLALAVVFSSMTVVFGALPMLACRRAFGRTAFWVGHVAVAAILAAVGLPHYGLVFVTLAVACGVYYELDEHGGAVFTSGTIAVLAATGVAALGTGVWLKLSKVRLGEELQRQVAKLIEQFVAMGGGASSVTPEAVIQQLPSAALIALVISLALAILFENRILVISRMPEMMRQTSEKLRAFRVPDAVVWLVMIVILGAFLKHGKKPLEIASVNVLNVLIVLYFFQGLAVISNVFRTFKVAPFWQAIWYTLFVLQLFLMVSLLGFVDYWLEFRVRLARDTAETNRGF